MVHTEILQKVQLVEGTYTPSEALQLVNSLIDEKIDFHKLKNLSEWMKNCDADCDASNRRIIELKEEKKVIKQLSHLAKETGTKIRINGTLEVTFVK